MIRTVKPDWILADVLANCSEAPIALVQRSLMKAAREFAKTCMFSTWIDIPTQENVQHYPFERFLPEGYGVEYIIRVKYNGCCIECVDDDCNLCAVGYTLEDMEQISLVGYCPQDECDTLQIKVVLRLNSDNCELPKDLVDRFEQELFRGTMGNLLTMKDKPWTDVRQGEYFENQFKGDIASAKCLIANKMNPTTTTMKPARVL